MLRQTPAVVLRSTPYRDSSLIISLYTLAYGRVDCLAKGVRKGKTKGAAARYQVAAQLEVHYYHKDTRELQTLKEGQINTGYQRLWTDPKRMVYGLLVTEVFASAVQEVEPNPPAFRLLTDTLNVLDASPESLFNPLLRFLLELTRLQGFLPQVSVENPNAPMVFDPQEGVIENTFQDLRPEVAWLHFFLTQTATACAAARVPGKYRQPLLELVLRYYALQSPGFRAPQSLEVFRAVFQG